MIDAATLVVGRVRIGAPVELAAGGRGEIVAYQQLGSEPKLFDCLVRTTTGALVMVTLRESRIELSSDLPASIARAVLAGRRVDLAVEQQLHLLATAYLRAIKQGSYPHVPASLAAAAAE